MYKRVARPERLLDRRRKHPETRDKTSEKKQKTYF